MTDERTPRLERLLEQTARKLGGALHPIEVLQRVGDAVEGAARDGVAPNEIRLAFHPADYDRYRPALPRLRDEIVRLLDDVERRRGLRRIGDRTVAFESSDVVTEGSPAILARFVDTGHREQPALPGATRRLTRQRGLVLVLGDGSRIRVTHTPFTIGRAPGNDLVLPTLAVSRRHAELVALDDGFALRDLGSRNGLVVDGERCDSAPLLPGRPVTVGDVQLTLEHTE
jgi:hypothetical protein